MSPTKSASYLLGIGALVGTIVGVGMFGLPFIAVRSGVVAALFYLLFFGVLMGLMHFLYFEVALHTREKHRFTGYVGYYMGLRWKTLTLVQGLISLWGTLLLYTVVGGEFLALIGGKFISERSGETNLFISPETNLFIPFFLGDPSTLFGALFFLVSTAVVLKGSYTVGKQELFFSLPLLLLIVVLFVKAVASPFFSFNSLSGLNVSGIIAPYGITLFALAGFSVVPTISVILRPVEAQGYKLNYPAIIFLGTLIPALLYALFIIAVVGVSGANTTPDALSGLRYALGDGVVFLGAFLGLLAIYTSFIATGDELKNTFVNDYRVPPLIAALLTFMPPLLFYIFRIRDFIFIANIVGSLMGGYAGIMILLLWRAMQKRRGAPPIGFLKTSLGGVIMGIFFFASFYALYETILPFLS